MLKKYRASTSALCAAQSEAREAECRAEAAAEEARQAKERLAELSARLAHAEAGHSHEHHEAERRLELRNKVPPATATPSHKDTSTTQIHCTRCVQQTVI